MSYLTYPRIRFSGTFQAYPSTINNYPLNYDATVYPSPNELAKVSVGWGPMGTGAFGFKDCVVTQVDYEDGTSATTSEEDPIVGQPVTSVQDPKFPIPATLVDLDPQQQQVSEIWALTLQIGGDEANLKGNFAPAAFSSIWGQTQGANAPQSSASACAVYQSTLTNATVTGTGSKFLDYFSQNPNAELSINFNVLAHNNNPQLYAFTAASFGQLAAAGVPEATLEKLKPLQSIQQNVGPPNDQDPLMAGYLPTKDFVTHMMQQYLTTEEYNQVIDTVLSVTVQSYTPFSAFDYSYGMVVGTVGTGVANDATYFVPSRLLCPQTQSIVNFAPFALDDTGTHITLNLGNALVTATPGPIPDETKLGALWLVALPEGSDPEQLVQIDYTAEGFIAKGAGLFTATLEKDYGQIPLGIVSINNHTRDQTLLLAENAQGYYLRADKYVFRMNPGVETTQQNLRGETARVDIHALKFGAPVADGTQIKLTRMDRSGTPESALAISPESGIAETRSGVASFTLTATDPGNPRGYIDGQLYFLNYGFADSSISDGYIQDSTDFISIQVYDAQMGLTAQDLLAKYGRLYKIMGFLADGQAASEVDRRNMIKILISTPMAELVHMPVTRDLSIAGRDKIVAWIDHLNNS